MLKFTILNGFKLAYLDEGVGPVVVLVHGFPMDRTLWSAQVAALADCYRVIVPDLPGFGLSDPVRPEELSISRMADLLAELLDDLEVTEPITLGGLSMGGYVVMDFLRRYADRLGRLVLLDTRPGIDGPEGIQNRERMARIALTEGEEGVRSLIEEMVPKLFSPVSIEHRQDLVGEMRHKMLATRPETIAASSLAMALRADATELLTTIDVPTLVVVGEDDFPSPPSVMRAMAESMPRATFVQLPDAGHLTPLEQPELLNEALLKFLQG